MRISRRFVWLACGMLCLAVGLLAGCESASTDTGITVTPEETTLEGIGATVLLTASSPTPPVTAADGTNIEVTLYLPLEWTVSNPDLGGILASAGYTAVYECNGTIGQNVITVTDQAGNEGEAAVSQRAVSSTD